MRRQRQLNESIGGNVLDAHTTRTTRTTKPTTILFGNQEIQSQKRRWFGTIRLKTIGCFMVTMMFGNMLFSISMLRNVDGVDTNNNTNGLTASLEKDSIRRKTKNGGKQKNENNPFQKQTAFAACLLVMDDSHFLSEWFAYHYHSIDLRRVILVMDPQSQTSPRRTVLDKWQNEDYAIMNITLWNDGEYYTDAEFQQTLGEVQRYFGSSDSNFPLSLAYHRTRQRLFYYKCLQTLKQDQQYDYWTLLTDSDEFITLNYELLLEGKEQEGTTQNPFLNDIKPVKSPDKPGFVSDLIQKMQRLPMMHDTDGNSDAGGGGGSGNNDKTKDQTNLARLNLQSSPCVQIPRIRYGAKEATTSERHPQKIEDDSSIIPKDVNASNFLTLRWQAHARRENYKINKVSKALIDLSRVTMEDIVPVTSIHLPIKSYCSQRGLHITTSQSFLLLNHYLGSLEQYMYRENDARRNDAKIRSVETFEKLSIASSQQTDNMDNIRLWLQGFYQNPPSLLPQLLLSGNTTSAARIPKESPFFVEHVGKLQPKSWTTYAGNSKEDRCALCFFGLPRAFKAMVLPSIIRNVLIPNARHNCDVYVHLYEQYEEEAGRKNRGGSVDPTEMYALIQAVQDVQRQFGPTLQEKKDNARTARIPIVLFSKDTNDTFWKSRGETIHRYQTAINSKDGQPLYFPYLARTYQNSSIVNIVKQWHSIDNAFQLSQFVARQNNIQYSRMAMLRSDVMYMTPVDISLLDNGVTDSRNAYAVVPGFAQMPVNDRMIYGPTEAIRIWATERFTRLEERAKTNPEPGYTLHSERFLNASIFPAIQDAGFVMETNYDLCFIRARADESVMVSDCSMSGSSRGWGDINKPALVESITHRNCTRYKMGMKWTFVGCGQGVKYKNGK